MISTEKFPFESFPIRLEYKDGKDSRICWFQCEEHLQKHLERYKLKKKDVTIENKNEKPTRRRKKHQDNVQQVSGTKRKRSSGTSKGRTTRLDSTRNTSSTTKPKQRRKK